MWSNPLETAELVSLTKEILNGKLHFLCSVNLSNLETYLRHSKFIIELFLHVLGQLNEDRFQHNYFLWGYFVIFKPLLTFRVALHRYLQICFEKIKAKHCSAFVSIPHQTKTCSTLSLKVIKWHRSGIFNIHYERIQ